MSSERIAELTQPQRDHLAFVGLRVRLIGDNQRQGPLTRLGIRTTGASRGLALYREVGSVHIDADTRDRSDIPRPDFQPLQDFPPHPVISWLTQGFGRCATLSKRALGEQPDALTPDQSRPQCPGLR